MAESSMYLEYSVVDLKPRILDFLKTILAKVEDTTNLSLSIKKKEIAEFVGKDTRTVTRYLDTLEKEQIIKQKGIRGRAGKTVILFNTDLIHFTTSEKAVINSKEPITIDDIIESNKPKKPKKETTRNRRTKQQMLEAKLLNDKKQSKHDQMNQLLKDNDYKPTWEMFQQADNPIKDYRTYLLSRLYNRYALLFTSRQNHDAKAYNEGNPIQVSSHDYDVLPKDFFGTQRWKYFQKLQDFCDENEVNATLYLSAQFARSTFFGSNRNSKNVLPFVNALTSDSSYEAYLQHCDYQKKFSVNYNFSKITPPQFAGDIVVKAIDQAYRTASKSTGFLRFKQPIRDFLEGENLTKEQDSLIKFYHLTNSSLKQKGVSQKSRGTIKKYLITQSLSLLSGIRSLPVQTIVGSEMTRVMLTSIKQQCEDPTTAYKLQCRALGLLTHPHATAEEQSQKGEKYLIEYQAMDETPEIFRLIMEQKGLALTLSDVHNAFQEYGIDKIPVDDYSILDVDAIVSFVEKEIGLGDYKVEDIRKYVNPPKEFPDKNGPTYQETALDTAIEEFFN